MRYAKSFFLFLFVSLIFAAALAGCPTKPKPPEAKSTITVGVLLKYEVSPFFREIEKGIRQSAKEKNVRVAVLAPESRSKDKQDRLFERFLALKANAIIFAPESSESCIDRIAEACRQKIPVILIDSDIDRKKLASRGGSISSFISCDNEKGGRLAGEYIVSKAKEKGTVLFVEGNPDSYTGKKRKKGLMEYLSQHKDFNVQVTKPTEFDRARAFKITREALNRNPNIIGVFAHNDVIALGVYDAWSVTTRIPICIVGYNATGEGIAAIKDGRMNATINQFPEKIGQMALESALNALKGEVLPPEIIIQPDIITRESLKLPFK